MIRRYLLLAISCVLLFILDPIYVNDIPRVKVVYASETQDISSHNVPPSVTPTIPVYRWSTDKKCPEDIGKLMFDMWKKRGGTFQYVPYCIAWYESSFKPTAHLKTQYEDSRGLFQVNIKVPYHAKALKNKNAFDPRINMTHQFKELVYYEKKGIEKGLTGSDLIKYVAKHGQRPKWTKWIEAEIDDAYLYYNNNLTTQEDLIW